MKGRNINELYRYYGKCILFFDAILLITSCAPVAYVTLALYFATNQVSYLFPM